MCLLGLAASTAEKIAQEITLLQRTDIWELEEPFHMGKVGSSTMPQKRNPSRCAAIIGSARAVRANVPLALEGMCRQGEGDAASSRAAWIYVAESAVLAMGVFDALKEVLDGLIVRPHTMLQNLERSHGLILSEALMMKLADAIGRQAAHEVVYEAAMQSIEEGISFRDALLFHPLSKDRLDLESIDDALKFENYLGLSTTFVDIVTQRLEHQRQREANSGKSC
jgi:adenylosuccinate lyase/3-carboxy-cis,cis-muconate cycloisomerase